MAPLRQRRFNQLMVYDLKANRLPEQERRSAMAHLGRLGWRDTGSLVNLLSYNARDDRVEEALDVVSALIRREQLDDQMIGAIAQAEASPVFRQALTKRLVSDERLRVVYLRFNSHLTNYLPIIWRDEMLTELLRQRVRLTPIEVAPSLWQMYIAGQPRRAYRIWANWRGSEANNGGGFDPEFRRLASIDEIDAATPIPFEWLLEEGSGYGATADRTEAGVSVNLRWDGRGVPTFIQKVIAPPTYHWSLRIVGPGLSLQNSRELVVSLACPGKSEVRFQLFDADNDKGLIAVPLSTASCPFPMIRIGARPLLSLRSKREWELQSVRIIPSPPGIRAKLLN